MKSRSYLDASNGASCVICGANDGTVLAAHYSGLGSGALGNGMGTKSGDLFVADLCSRCHSSMDSYEAGNDAGRCYEFTMAVLKTQLRRWRAGLIRIGK